MARRAERERLDIARRHARLGYGVLLLSALLGLTLEALHAFKVSAYLDASTRRLMWRLAHAHGALLGLVNLALAAGLAGGRWLPRRVTTASACLKAATVLLPAGFALGGIWTHGGDPGLGVLLVPVGALLLIVALGLAFAGTWGSDPEER